MIRKILFVDDDRVIQIIAKQKLADFAEHFSLVFANDGLDAIKKLENGCFALVCIDLIMPRMKGANLFAHIRSNFPHLPVIILSAKSKEEMLEIVPPVGVLEYFTKPFQMDLLGKCIVKQLQKEAQGGIMYNVSPPVFFQFMEMEEKTCTARVLDNDSQQGGVLYFIDGQLLEARVEMITGLDAAHKVFGWNDVTVFIEKDCPEIHNTINLPLQTVIMQAVSMKDEDDEDLDLQGVEEDLTGSLGGDKYSKLRSTQYTEICSILADDVSGDGIDDISQNVDLQGLVETIEKVGEQTSLGEFHLGIVKGEGDDVTVILPRKPPIEIKCSSESHAKEIVTIIEG
jgi:CheY-like chemotaxis protein